MAHLIFVAKKRESASYRLKGPAVLGRSVECDVYVPDVFVSRHHCRFEPQAEAEGGGWVVTDTGSRNGIFYHGKRIRRRALRHGDRLEIGSFAVRFESDDIPPRFSTPIPFGQGTSVAPLMDTLYAADLRPAEYLRQNRPKPAWVRAREEAAAAARHAADLAAAAARAAAERLDFGDGAELDLEWQIAEQAEAAQPEFVLVSRQLLARYEALLDQESGTPPADGTPPARECAATDPPDLAALDANRRAVTGGPADRSRSLWEQALTAPAAKAGVVKTALPAGATPIGRSELEVESTLRDRLGDRATAYGESLGRAIRAARASPVRAAAVVLVSASLVAGGAAWINRPPEHKSLNLTSLPVKDQRDVLVAQGN